MLNPNYYPYVDLSTQYVYVPSYYWGNNYSGGIGYVYNTVYGGIYNN
jgi:hypothetical protein